MVNFICSAAVNTKEVNSLPVTGASTDTALKLLSNPVNVHTPVAGKTATEIDLRPFTAPFFALTPNQ